MATVQDVLSALQGIRANNMGQANNPAALTQMAQYAQSNNIPMSTLQQAAGQFDPKWTPARVNQAMAQYGNQPNTTGLNPASATLAEAANQATDRINQTQQQVGGLYETGIGYIDPYMQTGGQANQLQAALSGAMGADAQRQAFQNYQASPGVDFAQQQAERALTRNAAATGQLGGGNTLRDLNQLAVGTYMQDFNNQFARLGDVATRGYGAATTGAGLQGQQAGIQAGLGQFAANIPLQTAAQQAGMQFQAGRDISGNIGQTSSALANLVNQQGAGMADMGGSYATNMNNLYQQAAQGNAQAQEQLAALLGNMSVQAGSQVGGLPIIPGQQTNYLGQLGQVAGGIGGIMAGLNQGQQTTNATPFAFSPNQGISAQAYGNMLSGNLRGY